MAKRKKGDEAATPASDSGEATGGGRKPVMLAAVVVAMALLGAGAMAGGLIGGGGAAAEAAETPAATPTPTTLGMLVNLEPLTINLADGRFLKVGAAVELSHEVIEEPATAPIYDLLIAEFNGHTVEELSDPIQRSATKASLLESLSTIYGHDIVAVYYTEFVMQ